ncbi:MAG TPA: hypothetical protein EYN06_06655 [Myxococcales bacterium]|nr:hypothetical protein [Myxococcales bacterium]HIN86143.1 hypothetical protein [Myxococcales bacterium]
MPVEPSQSEQRETVLPVRRNSNRPLDLRNPTMMVERPGWALRIVGRIFFRRVRFDDDQVGKLHDLNREGAVVYVMSSQSLLDYLYFNWAFLAKGLPLVVLGKGMRLWPFRAIGTLIRSFFRRLGRRGRQRTDDDILKAAIEQDKPVVIFLRKARAILPWFGEFTEDPLRVVVQSQTETDTVIHLVPIVLVWERGPDRLKRSLVDMIFGEPDAPGRIRKIVNFIWNHRKAIATVGTPIAVNQFLEEHRHVERAEVIGQKLRWSLNQTFHLENKVIKGPVLKNSAQIREELMRLTPFINRLDEMAEERNCHPEEVRKEAVKYLKEIVANWKIGAIEFCCIVLTFVFSRLYKGIEMTGLAQVQEAAKKAPLVVLPSHKSHIDYLLISFMFYGHGLVPPHIASGNNLNFFPLGPLFRRGGAFFLRRSFRQNPVYSLAFKTYVHKLLKEGYSLEFFMEGGRSRTGKLLKPRYGLLTHVIDTVVDGHTRDLQICPAAIGYEKIIEGQSYKRELGGEKKSGENLGGLIQATQVLASRYGRVYLGFDEPISLREFLEEEGIDLENGFVDDEQKRRTIKRLAYRVLSGINHSNLATSSSVVAQALLGNPRRGISRVALQARVGAIVDYLLQRNAPLASSLSRPLAANRILLEGVRDNTQNPIAATLAGIDGLGDMAVRIGECLTRVIDETTELFVSNKILSKHVYEDSVVYQLLPQQRLDLDYYMNNIVHHFVRESLLAATLLRCWAVDDLFGDRLKKETLFISQLLKLEYVFEQRKDFDTQYRETIQAFEESALIEGDRAARITIPRSSQHHLKLLAHLTLPVIEGYFVVARGAATLDDTIPEKEFLERLQKIGDRLWREGEITYKEAVSSVTFDNALSRLQEEGLVKRDFQQQRRKAIKLIGPGKKALSEPEACTELAEHLRKFLYRRI